MEVEQYLGKNETKEAKKKRERMAGAMLSLLPNEEN